SARRSLPRFICRLFQRLRLRVIGVGCPVVARIVAFLHALLIDVLYHSDAELTCPPVPESDHLPELPGRIDMQERERRLFRIERLQRQVKHHRAVLADGIQHDRVLTFRSHFAYDIDRLSLELIKVRQVCHGYNSFTNGYCSVTVYPFHDNLHNVSVPMETPVFPGYGLWYN